MNDTKIVLPPCAIRSLNGHIIICGRLSLEKEYFFDCLSLQWHGTGVSESSNLAEAVSFAQRIRELEESCCRIFRGKGSAERGPWWGAHRLKR